MTGGTVFALNILLVAYLVIVFPAMNLWDSFRPKKKKPRSQYSRYWSMVWPAAILLAVLGFIAAQSGYTLRELGLDWPLSTSGAWGLGFAVVLMIGLNVASKIMERRQDAAALAKQDSEVIASTFPWPRTTSEAFAFAASMFLMTAAWEILYRGYLLLVLAPYISLPGAVAVSVLAYGIGHGYKNPKQLAASVVSAFIFTIAYALSHSLWWLILIHAGLPLGAIPMALRAHRRRELNPRLEMAKQT